MNTAALQVHSAEQNLSKQWYNSGFNKKKKNSHSLKNNPAQMDGVANGLSEEFFKSSFKDWDFFDPSKTKG